MITLSQPLFYRSHTDLYWLDLPDVIPTFQLLLRSPDPEPVIDLRSLLDHVYERAGYDVGQDYTRHPVMFLRERSTYWMQSLLQDNG